MTGAPRRPSVRRTVLRAAAGLVFFAAAGGCASGQDAPPPSDPPASALSAAAAPPAPSTEPEGAAPPVVSVSAPVSVSAAPSSTAPAAAAPPAAAPASVPPPPPWPLSEVQTLQVEELMAAVESLRGRSFLRRPEIEAAGPETAGRSPDLAAGPHREKVRYWRALLELLGAADAESVIPPGLEAALIGADAPASDSYYDYQEGRIVLAAGGEPLDEHQRWVLAGVLAQALSHQHHPQLAAEEEEDPDRAAARLALLEGEAALVRSLYLDSLPPERREAAAAQAAARSGPELDGAPEVLVHLARFPARAGAALAVDLYRLGGAAALDQALDRPPATTEQVLHIERYRSLAPAAEVEPPAAEADGYLLVEEGTWGERRWQALLSSRGAAAEAVRAADGWGGDRYRILWEPSAGEVLFAVRYAADSFSDASEMNAAIRNLVMSGMEVGPSSVAGTMTEWVGGEVYAMLAWDVDALTFLAASDHSAGRRLAFRLGAEG